MSNHGEVADGIERAYGLAAHVAQEEVALLGVRAMEVIGEYARPSRTMRPRVFKDGDQWCALYGENMHDGVAGFGGTPEAACRAFDAEWGTP